MTLPSRTSLENVPDCRSGGPLRVLMVHQNECAFMCLWRLTTVFDGLHDEGDILWDSCTAEDLQNPISSALAAEQARRADVIVFCRADSSDLPRGVKIWIEGWMPQKLGQEAALGLLTPCGSQGDGDTETYLQDMAERGRMTFLGAGCCPSAEGCRAPALAG